MVASMPIEERRGMSDPDVRGEPATEVLDLYDVPPERADATREPRVPPRMIP